MKLESIAAQISSTSQNLTIYNLIAYQAERDPNAIAIVASERKNLTYSRLHVHISEVVETLNTMGLGRGDRIAIVLPNGPEMAVAFLAVSACATSAPLNPAYLASEFDFYLSDLNPKALIVQSGIESPATAVAQVLNIPIIELVPMLEAEAGIFRLTGDLDAPIVSNSFAQPEDVALVLHTSETTSQPKIVPLTQSNLCTSARNIKIAMKLQSGDRLLNIMPLFHIHGLSALVSSLSAGGSVVCTPGFDAAKFFEWMQQLHPTWYTAVPTMLTGAENNLKTPEGASLESITQILAELEAFSEEDAQRLLANAMRFKQILQLPGSDFSTKQVISRRQDLSPACLEVVPIQIQEEIEDSYQLSPMQQGMLFHSQYAPHSGVDIEQMIFTLHENLKVSAFKQAWQRVVERHPVLRTSFRWEGDNQPLQYVHRQVRLALDEQDWCGLSAKEQKDHLQAYLQADRQHGFQLTEAPLMRLALFRVGESDYQFIWTFHHIILDGRSFPLVIEEVFAFYDAFCQAQDLQLEQPSCYRDYIQWLQQQDLSKAESFFRQLLSGFTAPTPLFFDNAPSAGNDQQESSLGEQEIRLSVASTSQLQFLATQHQLTLNTLVQGAWALLLSRYSGETDVVFGATRACRKSSVVGAESMVGLLINTLPVRVGVSPNKALLPWLKELRAAWIALRDYEHTPLSKIQGWSEIPSSTPLFDSIVVFENYLLNSMLQSMGGKWENLEVQCVEQTNYPLTLLGYAEPELVLKIKYDLRRFDDATITRMLGHIKTLLSSMAANPFSCLGELPLLTADERHQILVEWNDTQADFPQDVCIHQLFEATVERNPQAIAVVFENQQLTYQELNCQANQIAHHLKSLGVEPGTTVGVYMDRSLEMIPALLGILKAGGAYVPLETSFPKARIEWILCSLGVRTVITQQSHLQTFDEQKPQLAALEHLICLDAATPLETANTEASQNLSAPVQVWWRSHLELQQQENLPLQSSPDDTAYIIFTSGSTGTPKGVVVRHKPVINLIEWVNKTFNVNANDRVLFTTSLCFDLSVYDVFGLLAAGGSIRVVSSQDVRDPQALLHILCNEPITFWDSAPPALQQLVPFFPEAKSRREQPSLRLVFMSGDWIPVTLPDLVKSTFPGVEVISLGGATEATVWSNFYPIGSVDPNWVSIPYGKPIQNAQYYILDSHSNPCPIGVPGELYIGGECLASGYTDPVKTGERFIPNPFSQAQNARLYKTGDLARYLSDSNIQFLGRIDHQVKIRGFRIELGEIEATLSQHPVVRESIVLAREDEPGNKRLVAYVALEQEQSLTTSDLRSFIKEKLPEYMVPSAFVILEALPLTPNGKVDRRALPTPESSRPELEKNFVAPQDTLELHLTKIWEEVLGIQPVGVKDNFFELGGNSLVAVRLFNQIEKTFGKNIPLAALFQAQTVEQLASILRSCGCSALCSSLVEIQPGNSKPPLFCVHEVTGQVLFYRDLARYLGPDQPIYAIQSQRPDGQAVFRQIENMAAHYIQEIRTLQPEGPYFLAGYSLGGLIVFEMAQQLYAQGQKVSLLALLDPPRPGSMNFLRYCLKRFDYLTNFRFIHSFIYRCEYHSLRLSQLGKVEQLTYLLKKVIKTVFKFPLGVKRSQAHPYQDVFRDYIPIEVQKYVAQAYPDQTTLFLSSQTFQDFGKWGNWSALATGGLEIHTVPAEHLTLIKEPHVRILAEQLGVCLDKAQANDSAAEKKG